MFLARYKKIYLKNVYLNKVAVELFSEITKYSNLFGVFFGAALQ